MSEKGEKTCPCCKKSKLVDDFHKNKSRKDGVAAYCKSCKSEKRKTEYWANPEENRRLSAEQTRKTRYGITGPEYHKMVSDQKGVCFLCGNPENSKQKSTTRLLAVDHCHKTGRVEPYCVKIATRLWGFSKTIQF
jgi:hypothetical protein